MSELVAARPEEDIAARRDWRGPTLAGGTLTPELAAFCQKGVAINLATCHNGYPIAGRGFAARVDEQGTVRILLRRTGHGDFLAALGAGAPIAATFTEPTRHRSIQLKGGSAREVPVTIADGSALALQSLAFRDQLMALKYSQTLSEGYCLTGPEDIAAIEFVPNAAFVQTPGPNAGTALTA